MYGSENLVNLYREGEFKACYFSFTYTPFIENGEITGVIDMAFEVTDQVLARMSKDLIIAQKIELEQTLRASEQRLQMILDTMAEGVGIIDLDSTVVYANQMAQKILRLSKAEVGNWKFQNPNWKYFRVDGRSLPADEHPMVVMMKKREPVFDQEIGIETLDNEKFYISINAAPIFDGNGELTGGVGTFMDVTSRRLISQHKDDFISIASHELKTPVTAMKAALQMLEKGKGELKPEMHERLIQQAIKGLDKFSKLVNDLLDTNRISRGQLELSHSNFSIKSLFEDCCGHVEQMGIHEVILKGDATLKLHADEQLLSQVLVNLVNNAVKYAPNGKQIIVNAEQHQNNMAKISVVDQGPGIEEDKLVHLFERYYRSEHGGGNYSGLGLGLYICAEIIKKHGGKIGVESKIGKGSTFWFTVPLAES